MAVDADSSQLRAVLTVLDGTSLVIQGPPGTGKSQTITNLVSSATARGKRVLFVAEKKAARDVVVGKLNEAGLSDLVLHITEEVVSGKSARAKTDIAEQFHAILEQGPGTFAVDAAAPGAFLESRAPLNTYVSKLHTPLNSAAWSTPYKLMEAWASAQQTLLPDTPLPTPSIYDVTQAWLDGVNEAAAKLDDLGVEMLQQARGPWWRLTPGAPRVDDLASVQAALETLKGVPERAQQHRRANRLRSVARLEPGRGRGAGAPPAGHGDDGPHVVEHPALSFARMVVGELNRQGDTSSAADGLTNDAAGLRDLARQHVRCMATRPRDGRGARLDRRDDGLRRRKPGDAAARRAGHAARPRKRRTRSSRRHAPDGAASALLLQLVGQMRAGLSVADVLDVVLLKRWAAEAAIAAPEFAATTAARARQRAPVRRDGPGPA